MLPSSITLTACLILAASGSGCVQGAAWKPAGAVPPPDRAAYLKVEREPFHSTYVVAIDGRRGQRRGLLKDKAIHPGRYPLWPGPNRVAATYDSGHRYSVHDVEVLFEAKPGHTYTVRDWPPRVIDLTYNRDVSGRSRIFVPSKPPPPASKPVSRRPSP